LVISHTKPTPTHLTSCHPFISKLFYRECLKPSLKTADLSAISLAEILKKALETEFRTLNLAHTVTQKNHQLFLHEAGNEDNNSENAPYSVSVIQYPEDQTALETAISTGDELILLFTQKRDDNIEKLAHCLDALEDHGAALKGFTLALNGETIYLQLFEKYYDFNVDTFNDYR